MPGRRKSVPNYLRHKQSGRGRVVWTDSSGDRRSILLPGEFNSSESRAAYRQFLAELDAAPSCVPAVKSGMAVNELLLAYLDHAEQHYRRPDGTIADEVRHVKTACRFVRELYGTHLATEFGPLALKAVRTQFIAAGWSRKTVNARVERIRRVFRWAVAEELVPPAVHQALDAVSGLQQDRTPARETEPVQPVADAVVDATLPFLNRHVRGLVEFQRLTGSRPGEACRIRRCDIDFGGEIWVYRPPQHKGKWRGKPRTISIGQKAQTLLREFFTPDINDYLFSPRRAVAEVRAERAAKRKTPRYPSALKRNASMRKANPKRTAKERYNRISYGTAIDRACDKAFPPEGPLARWAGESVAKWWKRLTAEQQVEVKMWRKAHQWAPNQLRHNYATKVRKEHGLEAAQVLLGHSKADVTQIYAERNELLAASIAMKIG